MCVCVCLSVFIMYMWSCMFVCNSCLFVCVHVWLCSCARVCESKCLE